MRNPAIILRSQPSAFVELGPLIPALLLMGGTVLVGLFVLAFTSETAESFPYLYLVPWIFALFAVFTIPTLYLIWRRRFSLADPLIFSVWSYLGPAFILGGLMLVAGWSQPYYLSYIQDPAVNLPYTIVLIMLGFAGMSIGYLLPVGSRAGDAIDRFLPKKDFSSSAMLIPGLFLLFLGTANYFIALVLGIVGYQKQNVIDAYAGLVYLTTLFWMQGLFIVWYVLFKRGSLDLRSIIVTGVLLTLTFGKALFAGNRASLLQAIILIILAFVLSGGRVNAARAAVGSIILSLGLVVGMIYGTTFRDVKGTESSISIDQYADKIGDTFDRIGRLDASRGFDSALAGIAERFDILSSVAVVVSNHEELAPYEESYGINDNIWKDLTTFFIPRIVWADKPLASEARMYSELYFDFGDSSFAITPFGDLLRNYGPTGVFLGMLILGILLRTVYRALIEQKPQTICRATLFFMLLVSLSLEGFYATIITYAVKVAVTALLGLAIAGLLAAFLGNRRVNNPA